MLYEVCGFLYATYSLASGNSGLNVFILHTSSLSIN